MKTKIEIKIKMKMKMKIKIKMINDKDNMSSIDIEVIRTVFNLIFFYKGYQDSF